MNQIEGLRFDYEKRLFNEIEYQLGPLPLLKPQYAQNLLEIRRQKLLGDAVHITPDLLPEVYKVYQNCLSFISDKAFIGNLFVIQNHEYNASIFAHENRFDLLIHSALLKDFLLEELSFVFGHELGHVIFGHHKFPIKDIIDAVQ